DVLLYPHTPEKVLKDILTKAHGILVIVHKTRSIYFIDNVKFHFDRIEGLGTFVEVEAIDTSGQMDVKILQEQCMFYATLFEIKESDYIAHSYSDLMLEL